MKVIEKLFNFLYGWMDEGEPNVFGFKPGWYQINGKLRYYDGFHLDGRKLSMMENYKLQDSILSNIRNR